MRTIPKTKRYVEPTFEKSYGSKHRLERATPGGDFYVVAWPIQVDVYTGEHRPSNAWYGAAQLLAPEVERIELDGHDQIHSYSGALFALSEGKYSRSIHLPHEGLSFPDGALVQIRRGGEHQVLDLGRWDPKKNRSVAVAKYQRG
jgi:hypothetical protein